MGPAMSPSEQPQADHRRVEQALEVSPQRAAGVLAEVHAADAASWLQDVRKEEAWQVFSLLSTEEQAAARAGLEARRSPLRAGRG